MTLIFFTVNLTQQFSCGRALQISVEWSGCSVDLLLGLCVARGAWATKGVKKLSTVLTV